MWRQRKKMLTGAEAEEVIGGCTQREQEERVRLICRSFMCCGLEANFESVFGEHFVAVPSKGLSRLGGQTSRAFFCAGTHLAWDKTLLSESDGA